MPIEWVDIFIFTQSWILSRLLVANLSALGFAEWIVASFFPINLILTQAFSWFQIRVLVHIRSSYDSGIPPIGTWAGATGGGFFIRVFRSLLVIDQIDLVRFSSVEFFRFFVRRRERSGQIAGQLQIKSCIMIWSLNCNSHCMVQ